MSRRYDAVVVGSGPNGLAAAITLARAGRSVLVLEAQPTAGGGARSAELTLPGFTHDVCSAVHPLGIGSPFFRSLPLNEYGLEWVQPPAALAHPLDDRPALTLERSVEDTAPKLGRDAAAYRGLLGPVVSGWDALLEDTLRPLRVPHHPLLMARFGLSALRSGIGLATSRFREPPARALLSGLAAHSAMPLGSPASASFGVMLGAAGHAVGWPIPRGGAGRIADALCAYLRVLGGEIETGRAVGSLGDLPPARSILLDLTPRQVVRVAGERLPRGYRAALERYRYGCGVFKADWALAEPIPWRDTACARAATVHLGGTMAEIVASEAAPTRGEHAERPFVLLAQPTLFDATRAPAGRHIAWAYCHVPFGSTVDMTDRIEAQIERFAPGFRDTVLARHTADTAAVERHNANLVGGDIGAGAMTLRQILFRPTIGFNPYRTPVPGLYLCSAATPPGGGVHGMSGHNAALTVLKDG